MDATPTRGFWLRGIKNGKWFSKNNPYSSFKQSIRHFLYTSSCKIHECTFIFLIHRILTKKKRPYEPSKQSEIKIKNCYCSRFLDLSPIKILLQRFINKHCIEIFKRLQLHNKPKSYDNLNFLRSIIKYK